MSDIKDILSGAGSDKRGLTEAQLQAYLEGKLSPEEQHAVEAYLSEEGMESDALEGLKELDTEETKNTVGRLNHNLRKQLLSRKAKRKKYITENKWAWVAIVVVLVLVVLGYIVLKMSVKP